MSLLLEGRSAVVYDAASRIGGAVALGLAQEGARVFLADRMPAALNTVADRIRGAGGSAEAARIDVLDEAAVEEHAAAIASRAGGLDISFSPIAQLYPSRGSDGGEAADAGARATFVTTRAVARHMIPRRNGVILCLGGEHHAGLPRDHCVGGVDFAFDAIEDMRRQLALELAAHGIRFVTLEAAPTGSSPIESFESGDGTADTLTRLADVAAFAASDQAGPMITARVDLGSARP